MLILLIWLLLENPCQNDNKTKWICGITKVIKLCVELNGRTKKFGQHPRPHNIVPRDTRMMKISKCSVILFFIETSFTSAALFFFLDWLDDNSCEGRKEGTCHVPVTKCPWNLLIPAHLAPEWMAQDWSRITKAHPPSHPRDAGRVRVRVWVWIWVRVRASLP